MVSRAPLAIGIDLGGTKIAGVLVDEAGTIVTSSRVATEDPSDPEMVVGRVAALVEELGGGMDADQLLGLGIGVAGQIEPGSGLVHHAPNLGWRAYPFGRRLAEQTGRRTLVLNDVQAATYGEWRHGAAKDARDAVCVFAGTGIGGGIISGGVMLHGAGGSAGELGHMVLDVHGPVCRCGNRGCLEAYSGGWAITRRAFDAVRAHPTSGARLLDMAGGRHDAITAAVVAEAAHTGDALARTLVREAGEALAAGAITIVNMLNPAVLILGGGVIDGLPELADVVRERVRMWALPSAARDVRVVRSRLGGQAGAIGAAAWLRRESPAVPAR
jgi:glucokinase